MPSLAALRNYLKQPEPDEAKVAHVETLVFDGLQAEAADVWDSPLMRPLAAQCTAHKSLGETLAAVFSRRLSSDEAEHEAMRCCMAARLREPGVRRVLSSSGVRLSVLVVRASQVCAAPCCRTWPRRW